MRRIPILILFLIAAIPLCAQRVSIAFYNVENLFDTIPSLFYDDLEYTPAGSRKWGSERYGRKISNIARVLDDMSADIVGLGEVENEEVVRDLVIALETDYNYIHRTSGDSRGIDVALLYKGDKFFPKTTRLVRSGIGREFMVITGELLEQSVEIVVCHMPSNFSSYNSRLQSMSHLRNLFENLLKDNPATNIIAMGDMNATPGEKVVKKTLGKMNSPYDFMFNPHWRQYEAGKGTYWYRNHWYLYDWMMVSPSLARGSGIRVEQAAVFVKEYMTEPSGTNSSSPRKPLRTFYGGEYLGGYSDHLPVYMLVEK